MLSIRPRTPLAALVLLALSLGGAAPSLAQIDGESADRLDGTWLLDAQATELRVREHPEFDQQMAEYLPMLLEGMASMRCTFGDGRLSTRFHGQHQSLAVEVTDTSRDRVWLKTEVQGQIARIEVEFLSPDRIVLNSSASDDMSTFVWRRAQPGEKIPEDSEDPRQQAEDLQRQRAKEVERAMQDMEGGG